MSELSIYENYFKTSTLKIPPINKEDDNLFNGDLDDIDVWIRHEEFRLKKKDMKSLERIHSLVDNHFVDGYLKKITDMLNNIK